MKIYTEDNIRNFDFWSGARDTVKYLTDDELDTIESILEDSYPDGMSDTELNDFFWFEDNTIAEWLGYADFDELMHRDDEDDDDDDWDDDEEEEEEELEIRYWEVEFECDDSWSVSGIYSFYVKKETEPNAEDVKRQQCVSPNKDGLGNIVRIIDITDELEYHEGLPNDWEV